LKGPSSKASQAHQQRVGSASPWHRHGLDNGIDIGIDIDRRASHILASSCGQREETRQTRLQADFNGRLGFKRLSSPHHLLCVFF
jgi:hypothetical protein